MKNNLVLIIGAMKSGTTSLFDHLASHPQVAFCTPKEPGYFAFEEIFNHGETWYESLFSFDPQQHKVALDGSTDYSKYPHCNGVLERIKQYGARPKILYIMRHPLRRIESHARHVQFAHRELGQLTSPRDNHSLDFGVSDISMDISRYAMQIDQYRSFFDLGQMKLLTLEDLECQKSETFYSVCDFLGLDRSLISSRISQQNRGTKKRRIGGPHPLWRAAHSVKPLRQTAKTLIPRTLRDRLRTWATPRVRIEGRFRLTAEEERMIISTLSDDLLRLRDVYGVDIERVWSINI